MFILEIDVTTFSGLARAFFASLDAAIYSMIAVIYNLIEDLANTSILSMVDINDFARRIYTLLGLFMLFKISFSIINYIVSPDKMTDNSAGMGSIIKNVIITLVLILIVPTAFNILYDAQAAILTENVIPKFLLGTTNEEIMDSDKKTFVIHNACTSYKNENGIEEDVPTVDNTGIYLSLLTFRAFYQVPNGKEVSKEFINAYCAFGYEHLDIAYYLQSGIYNHPVEPMEGEGNFFTKLYSKDILFNAIKNLFGVGPSTYDINYNYFVSTICGLFVLLILISMAFEVAVRSVKLTFLQLISPIPIISYIDPKSGKDGMFKRWYTEVFKTWASLFIRLASVYFGVYLIQKLDGLYLIDSNRQPLSGNFWIQLFMLIGVLMFCKQLPKLLEELIPGMKGAGSFTLNPLKNVSENALGGKFLTGAAVGAGAMGLASVGAAGANFANSMMNKKGLKNSLLSAGRGLGTGAFYGARNGLKNGYNGKYNVLGAAGNSITQSSKHRNYEDMLAAQGDKGPFRAARQSVTDKFTDVIGFQGTMGGTNIVKNKIRELNEQLEQEQGRENQYNTAFGNLSASKPAHVPGYVEAGKYSVEKNKDTGNFEAKMQYENFKQYRDAMIEMQKASMKSEDIEEMKRNIDSSIGPTRTQEERNAKIQEKLNEQLYANSDKFITEQEFKDANTIAKAVAESGATQKQIKADIKKIESNQNSSDSKK